MRLSAGARLGPYEILGSLGKGGMGEVYRARDQKLDRDVAIKVLPKSVAANPDTLARFEREAKAVAALSHPNILSIFDFGAQAGISYAVMELLEGETLRGKLDFGPITPARRAVEAAPSNHLGYFSLASALFFQKDLQSFRIAAERAIALNPMDGNSIAFLGELLTYAGDRERGLALARRAKQLNPHYPGWYWYADFYNAYRQGDDRSALEFALEINLPGQWFWHAAMTAAYGQLGERAAADKAARDLLKLRPDFASTVRGDIEKWWESEYVERLIDGWRKAGLDLSAPARR